MSSGSRLWGKLGVVEGVLESSCLLFQELKREATALAGVPQKQKPAAMHVRRVRCIANARIGRHTGFMVVHGVDIDALTEEQRQELLAALQDSLRKGERTPEDIEADTDRELLARMKAHRDGELKMLSVDEALAAIKSP